MICLKISIFVVSNTTRPNFFASVHRLWFAWKFLSLWYQTQLSIVSFAISACCDLLENFYLCGIKHNVFCDAACKDSVVICLKISIFVVSNTTDCVSSFHQGSLWFAWKFLSLWYQTQLIYFTVVYYRVVICLKISIFVVSNTTDRAMELGLIGLWFAWKFLSLWYQTQPYKGAKWLWVCCDLLENFYLCGIKHNMTLLDEVVGPVVICLKISIFVVSNTTHICKLLYLLLLWFAWKFLSLWYQTQQRRSSFIWSSVVICLKISIFVVSNTTDLKNAIIGFSCDLLENFYLCGIKHNISPSESNLPCVVICLKISIFVVSNTTC